MAEKKITELTRLADIKDLDLLAGVNTKNDETVKMTAGDLRAFILAGDGTGEVVTSVTEGTQSGTIAVNGEDVFVKDIKSAAFSDRSEFDLAGSADKALEDANIHTDIEIQTVNTRVNNLETSLTERINQAEENTAQLETKLTEDINTAKSDLTDNINKVETDLTNNISTLETDTNTRMDQIEATAKEYADQAETNAKTYSDEQLTTTMAALKISDIPNDTGFITNAVDSLVNYYKKSETYTQAEVNELIAKINSFEILLVDELPTENINDHAIYFVRKAGEGNDFYEEYVYVNNTWEYVGNTIIDLSGKADVEDIEELQKQIDTVNSNLNTKANQSSLDALQTQVNNIDAEVAEKAAQSSLNALQSEVDNLEAEVAKKVAQSSLDTLQNEVDNLESVVDTKIAQEDFNSFQTQVDDTFNGNEAMGSIVVEDIKCRQLFDKNDVVKYYYLLFDTGVPTYDVNMSYTQTYIEVEPITAYTVSADTPTMFLIAQYDENKNFIISNIQNDSNKKFTFNTNENAKYVRLSVGISVLDSYLFQKGNNPSLDYETYKKFGYNSQESMGEIVVDDISCKNKFNFDAITVPNGTVDYVNKTITVRPFANGTEQTLKQLCPDLEAGKTYILSFKTTGNSNFMHLIGTSTDWRNKTAYTMTQTDLDNILIVYGNYEVDADVVISEIQIEEGSTVTKYTPYIDFNATGHAEQINNLQTNIDFIYNSLIGSNIVDIGNLQSMDSIINSVFSNANRGWVCYAAVGTDDSSYVKDLLGGPGIGNYTRAIFKPIWNSDKAFGLIEVTAWAFYTNIVSKGWIAIDNTGTRWTGWTYQSRNTIISTSEPSGGKDGDIWIKYTE